MGKVKLNPSVKKKIDKLADMGRPISAIAEITHLASSTVSHYLSPGRKRLTVREMDRISEAHHNGQSLKVMAERFRVSQRTISRVVKKMKDSDPSTAFHRGFKGKSSILKPSDIDTMVAASGNDPFKNASQLQEELPELQKVSLRTVQRQLVKAGLPARKPASKPSTNERIRAKRLDYAKKFSSKAPAWWKRCLFSDETYIALEPQKHRYVRRPKTGLRFEPKYCTKKITKPKKLLVWALFSGSDHRELVVFPEGVTMNKDRYKEILNDKMLPHYNSRNIHSFQHDGAAPHTARVVKDFLREHNVNVLPHPPLSPDLAPIENAFSVLKNKINHKRMVTLPQVTDEACNEWHSESMLKVMKNCATSMTKRLKATLENGGLPTRY